MPAEPDDGLTFASARGRWVLLATLVLSVISLFQIVDESGLQLDTAIEVVSCALTAAGLYCSFTGDARGWFNA